MKMRNGKHLLAHLVLDLGIVRVRVEHDHRVGQHVRHISALEVLRVAADVTLGELLDQPVNLLRLPWQSEPIQENPGMAGCIIVRLRREGRGRRRYALA